MGPIPKGFEMLDEEKAKEETLKLLLEKVHEMVEATQANFKVIANVLKTQRDRMTELEARIISLEAGR
jgi:hypothetical protein